MSRQPDPGTPAAALRAAPATRVAAAGVADFDVVARLFDANGLPVLDWDAADTWTLGIADVAAQPPAWSACETAWLQHLGAALGPDFRLVRHGPVVLLSSQDGPLAAATLAFVDKTLQRIQRLLDGLARGAQPHEQEVLIVFDDDDDDTY